VRFGLDDGRELRFVDPRRFGLIDALPQAALAADARLCELGIEPLSRECDAAYLLRRARGRRRPIKDFLMDAHEVAGVGNIYASEALFLAGIHPRLAAGRLGPARWERLVGAIKTVLADAIREGGTTLNDFRNAHGELGAFQARLRVYDRAGAPCPRCASAIRRIVQSGRATYYCGSCQR
jgi:formamidopyrimidine-DNA glycosylase